MNAALQVRFMKRLQMTSMFVFMIYSVFNCLGLGLA